MNAEKEWGTSVPLRYAIDPSKLLAPFPRDIPTRRSLKWQQGVDELGYCGITVNAVTHNYAAAPMQQSRMEVAS
ncbi:hypothetical protein CIB48_g9504 [Xylaria polymorpha]|nr:hypothetical protein CIB48_g9504 [Xylaria polymorpha]